MTRGIKNGDQGIISTIVSRLLPLVIASWVIIYLLRSQDRETNAQHSRIYSWMRFYWNKLRERNTENRDGSILGAPQFNPVERFEIYNVESLSLIAALSIFFVYMLS
ncbi:BA75_04258T0 [Komagataella pastoris]|uniref:BA75_04258T0 n=1 Tax=Komagataella pastoris TaxID=4922 RepID=A0A1B2JFA1_PICPA|nr:BA75_04258T0 [Komagataella pastoris]